MSTLFDSIRGPGLPRDLLGPETAILNGFALGRETELAFVIQAITKLAPLSAHDHPRRLSYVCGAHKLWNIRLGD
jgi:hypothetical protein